MAEHGDAVWRVCLMRLGSRADAQDAFQETFLKYATHDDDAVFQGAEHERAWLLRVASNHCVDVLSGCRRVAEGASCKAMCRSARQGAGAGMGGGHGQGGHGGGAGNGRGQGRGHGNGGSGDAECGNGSDMGTGLGLGAGVAQGYVHNQSDASAD